MASSSGGRKLGEGDTEHDLIHSLDELCKEYDPETARQAIQTMLTLANNIIKSPEDEKYRKVKTQNKAFSSKVWSLPEAQEFLLLWGWDQVDECVVLKSDEDVQLVKQILQKKLNAISLKSHAAAARLSRNEPLTEKKKQLQEERKKLMEMKKLEEQEKARIKAQIQADRRDTKDRESRESRARKLDKFGGKMTKFEDIGVDLNKGGG